MQKFERPVLCLAASGGGHIRQILDLKPLWENFPHYFVTEDTAMGQSVAEAGHTYFVPHFAIGQARLGAPVQMVGAALRSVWQSAKIIFGNRPDIVITTGAGSMLFIVLWARLRGARVILIDSYARFDRPSAFARFAGPLAHRRIAQAAESSSRWVNSLVFDPFKRLSIPRPNKEPLLFATVGATLPFDRLVSLVEHAKQEGLITEQVLIQTGSKTKSSRGIKSVKSLPYEDVLSIVDRADIVVCHGGTGSLITALRAGCRVIAVPRRHDLGEHYDDHQTEITTAFQARGLLTIANTNEEFAAALNEVRAREPECATLDPAALIDYIRNDIVRWQARKKKNSSVSVRVYEDA